MTRSIPMPVSTCLAGRLFRLLSASLLNCSHSSSLARKTVRLAGKAARFAGKASQACWEGSPACWKGNQACFKGSLESEDEQKRKEKGERGKGRQHTFTLKAADSVCLSSTPWAKHQYVTAVNWQIGKAAACSCPSAYKPCHGCNIIQHWRRATPMQHF